MSDEAKTEPKSGFWARHGDRILLVALYLYVVILGIGVVAEAFDIQSILRLYP